ncbi:hypothetical protein V5F53_06310 [Xanthobacter sp. V4C-4]|uniref:hypothetical protein n=1 Tax=Xanthobacter cornucopiae TaxID=3119924 RepID=UPI00372A0304
MAGRPHMGLGRRAAHAALASASLLAATLALTPPARAEPAWRELQGPVRGATFGEAGGIALFVLGCGAGPGLFIQAPLPEGARPRNGGGASLALEVDGRRFGAKGRVAVDENAEGGPRGAVVARVRAGDPLVKALGAGQKLKLGKGEAALVIPLDSGAALLAKALATCGAPAPTGPATAAADPAPPAGQSAPSAAEARPATDAKPAPEAKPAAETKPARGGAVPPARDIALAIFVDQAEGQRVADKLKVTPVDLSGDGAPEAIVTLNDPAWCAETGCTWFVVDLSGKPRVMGQFIGLGLTPRKEVTEGWRDLSLKTPGGVERMSYRDGSYH